MSGKGVDYDRVAMRAGNGAGVVGSSPVPFVDLSFGPTG